MSLFKMIKAWRAALKFTVFRKAPKLPAGNGKPTVVPKAKSEAHVDAQSNVNLRFQSSLLRSVFSRYCGLVGKHSLSYLRPRNAGVKRMRNVPVFSLLGVSLGLEMEMDLISDSYKYKESTMSSVREIFKDFKWEPDHLEDKPQSLEDLDINTISTIGNGCEGAVFEAKLKNEDARADKNVDAKGQDYNLAVKAVFNYGAESNASSILRDLKREMVPLQSPESGPILEGDILNTQTLHLPPHPNIVDMHGVFVDDMLVTEQGKREFPAAMPRRYDPEGCFGRNKTLYLVMRKCTTKLSDFLSADMTMTTRCLLLTQLIEAVHHMTSHGVAHRDIKADNILIDVPATQGTPRLQLCDFGCCLAEEDKRLVLPYTSSDVNLGGNSWLMAPEIACATPGERSILDFRRSDLWACGALAYQILGAENPFYPNSSKQLKSKTYNEGELPPLPDNVPVPIKRLVTSIMARDPSKRPSCSVAVLVIQMVLWQSSNSTRKHCQHPSAVGSNGCSGTRKRNHRVVVTKGSHKPSSLYIQYMNKERQKMTLILGKMFDLIKVMAAVTTPGSTETLPALKQGIDDISNFLCLSRLTQSDFTMALKFFH